MSENTHTPPVDFDVDAFISGIERAKSHVMIFQRPGLAGDLAEIDRQLNLIADTTDDDTLGEPEEVTELKQRRAEIERDLADSGVRFTVQALTDDEVDDIAKEARKAAKDRADEVAKEAREIAREQAVREGVRDTKELNEIMRRQAAEASNLVIANETGIRTLSAALVSPRMDVEQTRKLAKGIGQQQVAKIQEAFYELNSRDPEASLPKSWRNGTQAEGDSPF